jgi:hypothetical protein
LVPFTNLQWLASPNPTSDVVSVTSQGDPILLKNSAVHVKDMTGKLILEKTIDKSDFSIDMTTFNKGVYFLTISNSEVKTSIKVVKI